MDLTSMRDIDIKTVDPAALVDIRTVKIDPLLSPQERMIDFIRQVGNPYCYKYKKTIIKVSHKQTEASIEDRIESYLTPL